VADGLAALDAHSLSHVKLHCDPFTGPVDALLNANLAATDCSKGSNFNRLPICTLLVIASRFADLLRLILRLVILVVCTIQKKYSH
jgi:hypothetical protein